MSGPSQTLETAPQTHLGAGQRGDGVKCEGCAVRFVPARKWQRFCSRSCRNRYHAGGDRGQEPTVAERLAALEARVAELERRGL